MEAARNAVLGNVLSISVTRTMNLLLMLQFPLLPLQTLSVRLTAMLRLLYCSLAGALHEPPRAFPLIVSSEEE